MALRWEPTYVTKHSPRVSPYTIETIEIIKELMEI